MDLSCPSRHIDSKGSTVNRSLSSALARAASGIAILRYGSQGSNCRGFRFSIASVLIVGSTVELLVSCSGGQFSWHWLGS